MRKLLISLVILLLAGGTVFYFGWVQLQLPENTYGVVFTKTGGWDKTVMRPGEFHWRWERLLPTNFTLHVFASAPHRTMVRASGTLPSADVYSGYLEEDPDFSYEVELSVSYRVKPEELPRLASEEDLDPEGLEGWYGEYDARIRERAPSLVREIYGAAAEESPGEVSLESLEAEIRGELSTEYPALEFLSAVPTTVLVPDFTLYEAARSLYLESVNARREAVAEQAFDAEQRQLAEESRLETLRSYGQILTEFPVLLDYFRLSAEQDVDPLELDALRELGQQVQQGAEGTGGP
jgi:hypothetical protein